MRNLKRALSLALASVMLVGMMVVGAGAASFPDVDANDNTEAIDVLNAVEVMLGDGDTGNFRPDDNVSRNEMAVIMAKLILGGYAADSYVGSHPFADVPSWADRYVAACYNAGIIAGRGEGIYDGSSTVTAVEAAAMMLRALGYEDLSKGAEQWDQPVAAKANSIELFEGLSGSSNTELTRNDVAKLALNTLKATTVTTEKEGDIVVQGVVTIPGKITYSEVESSASWADDIDATKGTGSDKFTVQLGEKLYKGDLKLDKGAIDDFGRPASKWLYKSDEIITVADEADASYTAEVKGEDLYKDLGLAKTVDASVMIDGKAAADFSIVKNDADSKLGGNGVLVEAYKDSNGNVTIAIINPYVGEITKVTEAKGNDARTVTVGGKKFETEAFEVDDVVVYTVANNEIKTMFLAESAIDVEVTRTKSDSEFVAEGTTYKYAQSFAKVGDKTPLVADKSDVKKDNRLDLYLDSYGYVVKVELNEGVTDYAYVIEIGADSSRFGSDTFYAKLLLSDGTVEEAELDKDDYDSAWTTGKSAMNTQLQGYIVEYSVNSKDVYKLERKSTMSSTATANQGITIDAGKAKMVFNGTNIYADSKTIFLTDDGDDNYKAYVGYDEVPDLSATGDATTAFAYYNDGVAKVVYVKGVEASTNDIVFLLTSECSGKITVSGGDDYYECPAVVNGEIVTVKLNASVKNEASKVLLKTVVYSNEDEEIINFAKSKAYSTTNTDDNYYFTGTVTKKLTNGNLTVDNVSYRVADDAEVFVYDDDINTSSKGAVDKDDTGYFVINDGQIVSIFYAEAASGSTPSKPTVTLPGLEVTVRKDTSGYKNDEWEVDDGTIQWSGETQPTTAEIIDAIKEVMSEDGWTCDDAETVYDSTNKIYTLKFSNAKNETRYVKYYAGKAPAKVIEVSDSTKLEEALADGQEVHLTTDATLSSDVPVDTQLIVEEGSTLTLSGGQIKGYVNGDGDVKITGNVTDTGNINTSGTITIGAGGSFDVLGQGVEGAGPLHEANVVLDGTNTISGTCSVYGTTTIAAGTKITINADGTTDSDGVVKALHTNRLVIKAGATLEIANWSSIQTQNIVLEEGAFIGKSSETYKTLCKVEISMVEYAKDPDDTSVSLGFIRDANDPENTNKWFTFDLNDGLKKPLRKASTGDNKLVQAID